MVQLNQVTVSRAVKKTDYAAKIAHKLSNDVMKNKLGKYRIPSHVTKEAIKFQGEFGKLSLGVLVRCPGPWIKCSQEREF